MAVALPDGWVDTGISRSVTVSGDAQLIITYFNNLRAYQPPIPSGVWATFGPDPWSFFGWRLSGQGFFDSGGDFGVEVYLEGLGVFDDQGNPWLLTELRVQQGSYPDGHSRIYHYSETTGPWRLGVRYRLIDPATAKYPQFAQRDYLLEYGWFGDRTTTKQTSFDGHSAQGWLHNSSGTGMWQNAQDPSEFTPVPMSIGLLLFAGRSLDPDNVNVRFSGLTVDGETVDTSELKVFPFTGTGAGGVDAQGNGEVSQEVAPSYRVTYNVDVTKNGGATTGARLVDNFVVPVQLHADGSQKQPQADYLTCPIVRSYIIPVVTWETHKKTAPSAWYFDVQEAWRAAQDPAWRSDDLRVGLQGTPARALPGPANSPDDPRAYVLPSYKPVTLSLAAEVNVYRPDGNQPSSWAGDAGISVSDPPSGPTVFTVSATGGVSRRVFKASSDTPIWRRWCGVGTLGQSDPLFDPDRAQATKHTAYGAANQDVFGWESYGYLKLAMQLRDGAPSGNLTLRVEGVHVSVSDGHETSGRTFSLTETPFAVDYQFHVNSGDNTVEIDLLQPTSGVSTTPFYLGRVDALQLSGFGVGTYELSEMKLAAKGDTYWKVDWGPPVQRGDYSAAGWSNGGSFGAGGLPDQANKPDEVGSLPLAGGNLRYIRILNDPVSGVVDEQLSLGDFLGQFDVLEGWTYSYSQAAFDAANKDPYNVSLAPELAQNLRPQVPYYPIPQGETYQPPCNWTCRQMALANAQPFVIYTRWPLGHGALEAVVLDENGRANGVKAAAVRDDTGAVLAHGISDDHAYVVVTPVPADGSRLYRLTVKP